MVDVRDIGLRGAKDPQIAAYAQSEGLCLVTGDFDFSDIRDYPPGEYAGSVVLKLPRTATASLLLTTKLYILASRSNLVPRPRLTRRLYEGLRLGHRLR